jgi:replicative DNA helicase
LEKNVDLASALLKQIISQQDIATWTLLRKNYLPPEHTALYDKIDSFLERFQKLPSFEELKFDAKNKQLQQKIAIVEKVEVEAEPELLLEFLKSDYAQQVVFENFEKLLDSSVAFESASDTVESLQNIIVDLEKKIDLEVAQESMQRIELFEPEENMHRHIGLGLNAAFDAQIQFSPEDLILIGGKRGAGKSITCSNIVASAYKDNKSSIYFTIEMNQREILQRITSAGAGVSHYRLKNRTLSTEEIVKVAKWWAGRYQGGLEFFEKEYSLTMSFDDFHKKLSVLPLNDTRFEIIYDSELTISKIRSELERKVQLIQPKVIIVDYMNQIKLSKVPSKKGQYDWTEQIEVSKFLKTMAQKYKVPVVSPYQIDASGEARFAKGILDAADAAFTLDAHTKEDNAISFKCTKMRGFPETDFTSFMDWECLKLGPDTAIIKEKEETEEAEDKPW